MIQVWFIIVGVAHDKMIKESSKMKTASYRVVRMSVCYQDVEEEVMYGIEAICPEEGKVLDRVCRISENEAEVQKLSEMMNQNELSLRHFRCVVDDFRH